MSRRYDVVVVGGGPAGLATAAACARRGLAVALFERRSESDMRVGETLGAAVAPYLVELGAWHAVEERLALEPRCSLVRAAWGSGEITERPSIVHPLGAGWHVDRALFDQALCTFARSSGVLVQTEAGQCTVAAEGEGFSVRPRHGSPAWGRWLVDASGRGAPATAALGQRSWLAVDRQAAIVARMVPKQPVELGEGLLLEAVEEGFWYSAPMADGALIVVLVTDSDVLVGLGRDRVERFHRALDRSVHTAGRAWGLERSELPRVFRSDSGRLIPDRGPGWRAVGDAAMATDPLGGSGVARALHSALTAAASLGAPEERGLAERRFGDYLDERASYYWLEGRWPTAPFWARRRPLDGEGKPLASRDVAITLAPDAPIRWQAEPAAAAEAWLPPAALSVLRAELVTPQPAHRLMVRLREVAPLGDRRLLVALQWLLATGTLAIA